MANDLHHYYINNLYFKPYTIKSNEVFNKLKKYIHIQHLLHCIRCINITSELNQVNSSTEILFSDYFMMGLNSGLGLLLPHIFKIAHVKLDSEDVPKASRAINIVDLYRDNFNGVIWHQFDIK